MEKCLIYVFFYARVGTIRRRRIAPSVKQQLMEGNKREFISPEFWHLAEIRRKTADS
ncbi:MAG TPA: hypothetical protein PKE69_05600 [Pyrinomonadaceae bacterium]|nr:hypothetical protein [Pyrinomonadaceae bacterium]